MKGLILKDFINLKSQLKIYLMILIMWLGIGLFNDSASFFSGVMQMFVVMIPITAMAYDDKTKWDCFALTMPLSRKELVLARYVFMLMVVAFVALSSMIGCFIINKDMGASFMITLLGAPVGLILNGVLMPIIFQFGVEKGRYIFIGVITLFVLLAFVLGSSSVMGVLNEIAGLSDLRHGMILLWAAAFILTGTSILLAVHICQKKDY